MNVFQANQAPEERAVVDSHHPAGRLGQSAGAILDSFGYIDWLGLSDRQNQRQIP